MAGKGIIIDISFESGIYNRKQAVWAQVTGRAGEGDEARQTGYVKASVLQRVLSLSLSLRLRLSLSVPVTRPSAGRGNHGYS